MRWHRFVDLGHLFSQNSPNLNRRTDHLKWFQFFGDYWVPVSGWVSLKILRCSHLGRKLSCVLPRTHSRSCQLLLFFKHSSWNTNCYHPKETALVAIQYSCQMSSNENIYQVDPRADIEETWETTEIEAEGRHRAPKWVKAESFHLKMCVQGRVMSILSHTELKSFGRILGLIL